MMYSQPSGGVIRGSGGIGDLETHNTTKTWMCTKGGFAALQQWEGQNVITPNATTVSDLVYRTAYESVRQYGDCSADVEGIYKDEDTGEATEGYLLTRPFFFRHVYKPLDRIPVKVTLHKISGGVASTANTANPRISSSLQDSQNLGLRFVPILLNTEGLCIPYDSFTNDAYGVKLSYISASPAGTTFRDAEYLFRVHDSNLNKQDFMIVGCMFLYDGLDSNRDTANFISPDSGRFVGQKFGMTEVSVTGCVIASNWLSDYPTAAYYWDIAPMWASNNVYQLSTYGYGNSSQLSVQTF